MSRPASYHKKWIFKMKGPFKKCLPWHSLFKRKKKKQRKNYTEQESSGGSLCEPPYETIPLQPEYDSSAVIACSVKPGYVKEGLNYGHVEHGKDWANLACPQHHNPCEHDYVFQETQTGLSNNRCVTYSENYKREQPNYRISGAGLPVCNATDCGAWQEEHQYLPLNRSSVLQPSSMSVSRDNSESKTHQPSFDCKLKTSQDLNFQRKFGEREDYWTRKPSQDHLNSKVKEQYCTHQLEQDKKEYCGPKHKAVAECETLVKSPSVNFSGHEYEDIPGHMPLCIEDRGVIASKFYDKPERQQCSALNTKSTAQADSSYITNYDATERVKYPRMAQTSSDHYEENHDKDEGGRNYLSSNRDALEITGEKHRRVHDKPNETNDGFGNGIYITTALIANSNHVFPTHRNRLPDDVSVSSHKSSMVSDYLCPWLIPAKPNEPFLINVSDIPEYTRADTHSYPNSHEFNNIFEEKQFDQSDVEELDLSVSADNSPINNDLRNHNSENSPCRVTDTVTGWDDYSDMYHYKIPITTEVCGPPQIIQNWLDKFSVKRKFGVITPGLKGGTYRLNELGNSMCVSVPEKAIPEDCPGQQLLFVCSKNKEDFPKSVSYSDVLHLLPHGLRFNKRIMVSFSLNASSHTGGLTLMYSGTDHMTKPAWRRVEKPSTQGQVRASDDTPYCFFADGKCHLFLNHFCLFTVVHDENGVPFEAYQVHMTMCGMYNPVSDILQISVPIQMNQETPPLPKMQMGVVLDDDSFLLKKDVPLNCELEILDGWEIKNSKVPNKNTLLNLDKLGSGPVIKISVRLKKTLDLKDEVPCKMTITQDDQKICLFDDSKILKQLVPENSSSPERVNRSTSPSKLAALHLDNDPELSAFSRNSGRRQMRSFKFSSEDSSRGTRLPVNLDQESDQPNMPDIPISNISPHIRERFWEPEPVLPVGLMDKLCARLNNCGTGAGWKELLHTLNKGELCGQFEDYENPAEAVLMWWQNERNLWSEFVEKLAQIGHVYMAEDIRQWRSRLDNRSDGAGRSNDPDETLLKVVIA